MYVCVYIKYRYDVLFDLVWFLSHKFISYKHRSVWSIGSYAFYGDPISVVVIPN